MLDAVGGGLGVDGASLDEMSLEGFPRARWLADFDPMQSVMMVAAVAAALTRHSPQVTSIAGNCASFCSIFLAIFWNKRLFTIRIQSQIPAKASFLI